MLGLSDPLLWEVRRYLSRKKAHIATHSSENFSTVCWRVFWVVQKVVEKV
jgi:hypothetical protein